MAMKSLLRWIYSVFFTLVVLPVLPFHLQAQIDIYADALLSSSADFQSPQRCVDGDRASYTYITSQVALLSASHLHVQFPYGGKAGDAVNIVVQSSGPLTVALLNNIRIRLYDGSGTEVASGTGPSVLQQALLSPGTNLYALRYFSSIEDTFRIREVRLELTNLLSASLFSEFRVYDFFIQPACPPVYASEVAGYTTGLLGQVTNPDHAVDADPDNYANVRSVLDVLNVLPSFIDLRFTAPPPNTGNYVGFTIARESGLLSLDVIELLEIEVYDQDGGLRASKDDFSLADVRLLAGSSDRYTIGFMPPAGGYTISRVRLNVGGLLALLPNIRVYNAFQYNVDRPPVTVTPSGPTAICAGGSITLTAFDSLGATNFVWSTGATTASITVSQAGTYSVSVTDPFGCTRQSVPVGITIVPLPVPVITGDSVLCSGASGRLTTATAYADYTWSTGSTSDTITVSSPGIYWVRVTDSTGCTGTDTVTVIRQNLMIIPSITPATCSDGDNGSITLQVSGGSGQYDYQWSSGSTTNTAGNLRPGLYTVTVTDRVYSCRYNLFYTVPAGNTFSVRATGIVNTTACGASDGSVMTQVTGGSGNYRYNWSNGDTTADISGLKAGIYHLTVTDLSSGCRVSDTMVVSDGPATLIITPSVTGVSSCNSADGSITLSVTGGSGSYRYEWSTGQTTGQISGLEAGVYHVLVTDNGTGCAAGAVIVVPGTGSGLTVSGVVNASACNDTTGSIVLTITNGTGPYTYRWSNGDTTATLSGLEPGIYMVTVTDNGSGCIQQEVFTVGQAGGPSAVLVVTQPSCTGDSTGSITVTATGPNRYLWSNGSTVKDQTALPPGIYILAVTDTVTGCQSLYQAVLNARPPILLTATSVSNTSCTVPNGSIMLQVSGGTPPYVYSWSNGETARDLTGLVPGTYTVTVRDNGGCTAVLPVPVINDTSKVLTISVVSVTPAHCRGSNTGAVEIRVNGAAPPVVYLWSNGAATRDLVNVPPGSYILHASDANGCSVQLTVVVGIDTPNLLRLTLDSIVGINCPDLNSGAVYITTTGGAAPYIYAWSNGSQAEDLYGVPAGMYMVVVTDNRDCTDTLTAVVTGPECDPVASAINVYNILTPNGDGDNDVWYIGGIERYPDNEVQIYDKWGDLVYERRGYDNSWDGTLRGTGRGVPDGTYFYVIRLNRANAAGGPTDFTGHLLIRR